VSRIRVRVRTATIDDVDALMALAGVLTDPASVRGRVAARRGPDGFRTQAARLLADPEHRVVVALDEADAVVGAAVFGAETAGGLLDAPSVYVSHLVVDPGHRKRGAGRALVAAAAGYADELDIDSVVVGVTPTGRDANRFFARLGFAPQVMRRVAPVPALRRALVAADPVAESTLPGRSGLARALPRSARSSRSRLRRTG
jgi:ribosomal protein S18 acetylase RimI-like enzyme